MVAGLESGTTYIFKVKVLNGDCAFAPFSNTAQATTQFGKIMLLITSIDASDDVLKNLINYCKLIYSLFLFYSWLFAKEVIIE